MKKIVFKANKAFTLVELMIAVTIVILLVALSINGLIRSRITANETAAIRALRTLHTAFAGYRIVNMSYPRNFIELVSEEPPYIDEKLVAGTRQGYRFNIQDADANTFRIVASPIDGGITGNRSFYIDQLGEIADQDGASLGATVGIPDQGGGK